MKIRTDFVTNSSDSCFVLTVCFNLKNGSRVRFEGTSGEPEQGVPDYFDGDLIASLDPRELGTAKSVEEMIAILTDGVTDYATIYHEDEEDDSGREEEIERKVFAQPYDVKDGEAKDVYGFIERIRKKIHSMDDIEMIEVSGVESYGYGHDDYEQHYYYDMETGYGYGKVSGMELEELGGGCGGGLRGGYCGPYDMEYNNTGGYEGMISTANED